MLPQPGSWDRTNFVLSNLANLSDRSGIARIDYNLTLLTHIRFEAFASMRWGRRTGEFRFGVDDLGIPGVPFRMPPALADFGLALRVSI
jgi:hypothetical protein